MSEDERIYIKIAKNKKILFLDVSLEDTVENVKAVFKTLFSKQEPNDILLLKNDIILNDTLKLRDHNIKCGDLIAVKFFRVVRPGNPPEWDTIDSLA